MKCQNFRNEIFKKICSDISALSGLQGFVQEFSLGMYNGNLLTGNDRNEAVACF